MQTALEVNGEARTTALPESTPLIHVLRGELDLAGTRFGCGTEQCGACLVLIDGEPAYACTTPLAAAKGRRVTTVEGLARNGEPGSLQQAFIDEQAAQCGYCISGILLRAAWLIAQARPLDEAAVREALEPHLCRCGSHNRIVRAVLRAATRSGDAP